MSKQHEMERGLKSRHVSMIAIGGAIGTGLFVAIGGVISQAGPGGALLAYAIIGVMLYFLMNAIGELAAFYPVSGAFSAFSSRFIDPSIGFAVGWLYFLIGVLVSTVDIIAMSNVITFWEPMQFLSPFGWSIVFFVIIVLLNIFTVTLYGEAEYWLSLIKVVTIFVFIIFGVLMIFGILGGHTYGLENYTIGEAPFVGGFAGFFSVLLIAGFSVGGTEAVAVTAGESNAPEESMPKAVKQVFWRILIFYIGSIVVIGAIIPYMDPTLLNESESVNQSPFTIVFDRIGIAFAASVINAVILTALFSGSNSMLYAASRMLYSLANNGQGPKFLGKISNRTRSPLPAVITVIVAILGIIVFSQFKENAIFFLLELVGALVIVVWASNIWAQIRLRRAIKVQGKDIDEVLPFKAKGYPVGAVIVVMILFLLFIGGAIMPIINLDFRAVFNHFLPFILFAVVVIIHKVMTGSKKVKLEEMDLSRIKE